MTFVEHSGNRLYYEDVGVGQPTLLMVHGWLGDHAHFAPQIGYFSHRNRVIAPDLPGHGLSDRSGTGHDIGSHAAVLARLIGALELKRPVVIGHSLGGMVALQLAVSRPDLVGGVVLLDTILYLDRLHNAFDIGSLVDRMRGPTRVETISTTVASLFGSDDDPARRDRLTDEMMNGDLDVAADEVDSMVSWEGSTLLPSCAAPVLAITTRAGSRSDASALSEQLPNLLVAQVVGSGKFLQLEVPDQINAMIERFLQIAEFGENAA